MQFDFSTIIQLCNLAGLVFLTGKLFYKEGARDTRLDYVEEKGKDNAEGIDGMKGILGMMERNQERQTVILERLDKYAAAVGERSHKTANIADGHTGRLEDISKQLDKIEKYQHERERDETRGEGRG